MRTNIVLDEALVAAAKELTGIRTMKALVDEALRTLIATRKRRQLAALAGRIRFADGYDHKALRTERP